MPDMRVRKMEYKLRNDVSMASDEPFSNSKKEIYNFAAILFCGVIELILMHIFLVNIDKDIAIFVSAMTALILTFLFFVMHGLIYKKIILRKEGISIDVPVTPKLFVPYSNIAKVESFVSGQKMDRHTGLRATVLEEPNIEISLYNPIFFNWLRHVRSVSKIGLSLDKPDQFAGLTNSKIAQRKEDGRQL